MARNKETSGYSPEFFIAKILKLLNVEKKIELSDDYFFSVIILHEHLSSLGKRSTYTPLEEDLSYTTAYDILFYILQKYYLELIERGVVDVKTVIYLLQTTPNADVVAMFQDKYTPNLLAGYGNISYLYITTENIGYPSKYGAALASLNGNIHVLQWMEDNSLIYRTFDAHGDGKYILEAARGTPLVNDVIGWLID